MARSRASRTPRPPAARPVRARTWAVLRRSRSRPEPRGGRSPVCSRSWRFDQLRSRNSSRVHCALDGSGPFRGGGDGRIASLRGLGVGEGPVGRPEPQRVGQRLLALTDLRAGVDVEQLTDSSSGPAPAAERRLRPPPPARRPSTISATSSLATGKDEMAGTSAASLGRAGDQRVEVDLGGAVRGGQAVRLARPVGCSSPACPITRCPSERANSAHRPGCQGALLGSAPAQRAPTAAAATSTKADGMRPAGRLDRPLPAGPGRTTRSARGQCRGCSPQRVVHRPRARRPSRPAR